MHLSEREASAYSQRDCMRKMEEMLEDAIRIHKEAKRAK